MREDLATKYLEEYPDVFADIGNVNLYDGKTVITPEELEKLPSRLIYRNPEGELKTLEADIRMRFLKADVEIALFCVENQSGICNTMPVRDIGYIYSGYDEQIRQIKDGNKKRGVNYYTKEIGDEQKLVPIIPLILYFGEKEWTGPLSLMDMLDIRDEDRELVVPLIQDYHIRLVCLGSQDETIRKKYRSDFRHVADYLAYRNDKEKMKVFINDSTRKLSHPEEFLDVIGAVSSDARYKMIKNKIKEYMKEGEEINMCVIAEELENRGIAKGVECGDRMRLIRQILIKQEKGLASKEIADMLEENESMIDQILLAIAEAGTSDIEEIYHCLNG